MKDEVIKRYREDGVDAAIEMLRNAGDIGTALEAFVDLQKDAFWNEKDLDGLVAIGQAGIAHGLAEADRLAVDDPKLAEEVRGRAKALSYNLASFTWPGWEDEGFEIGDRELEIGLEAARTNLRLARELDKGALALSRGHWVLGAHLLAASRYDDAIGAFADAARHAEDADSKPDRLLCGGYETLTRLIQSPGDTDVATELDRMKNALRPLEHGDFFVGQLESAQRVFS